MATSPDHDWTAAADLVLDRPGTDARFTVRAAAPSAQGLAPHSMRRAAFTFAFGSCHQPFGPPEDGTLTLPRGPASPPDGRLRRARDARFLALIGDQIYSDGVEPIDVRDQMRKLPPLFEEQIREAYRWIYTARSTSSFRRLLEAQPTLMAWDDHDIAEGWGALNDWDDLDWAMFQAAEATYREYQHVRHVGASVDDRATYHRSFWFGDVGFFVLDLRSVRSYRDGRLLGDRQWRDLYQLLEAATERGTQTLFIVAGIPLSTTRRHARPAR